MMKEKTNFRHVKFKYHVTKKRKNSQAKVDLINKLDIFSL